MHSCRRFIITPFILILNCVIIGDLGADVVFTAIGDTPYNLSESRILPSQIAAMDKRSVFIIHIGDIKSDSPQCDEKTYIDVANILKQSIKPVFIIPGDNEWNDCKNPDLAWQYWAKYFMRFDEHWTKSLKVYRQNSHPENFSFVYKDVLFIGINIVGGRVHDKKEWEQRMAANLEWTLSSMKEQDKNITSAVIFGHASSHKLHRLYFNGLVDQARIFAKPILYLQGDGHSWVKSHPFKKAKNILRVQIDRKGPLTVTVSNDTASPFFFNRK